MASVLCLDSDPAFVSALRAAGHQVATGCMGYGQPGGRRLDAPPHEFDAILSNLKQPVCFDVNDWGKGTNNLTFQVAKNPTDEFIFRDGQRRPKFQLVQESQLLRTSMHPTFAQDDVIRAVEHGGVPLLLFFNEQWLRHTMPTSPPNLVGIEWTLEQTLANKVQVRDPLAQIFPEYGSSLPIDLPIRYKVTKGPSRYLYRSLELTALTTVTNTIEDVFGQVFRLGHGTIWAIPGCEDNLRMAELFLDRIDTVRGAGVPRSEPVVQKILRERGGLATPPSPTLQGLDMPINQTRDVFISHASEDKTAIARPLAEALQKQGLTVWFDEYELTLGDSLRERIDEGLRDAGFGVIILSHAFFSKPWPKAELDGLFSLETDGRKRILPVWHGVDRDDVKKFSPILAGRVAARSADGVDQVVSQILAAVEKGS